MCTYLSHCNMFEQRTGYTVCLLLHLISTSSFLPDIINPGVTSTLPQRSCGSHPLFFQAGASGLSVMESRSVRT
ncbi:hypothetical protein CH063_02195 [Colletotrichum higginsianum]|uniref:Uncharacterized protein n=1 Tax=Colletotrichum higginsianum (strain IMI 349063) TaxID=759273 RepID=H1VHQ0_COLHI|nr:hypothetical protein CH63R_05861 [Colletotrichum higginsianum IMI 349063]OBR10169.1 hypothetical protein CH63R_05861 [Colletotrichum higginsianum IMI 349063]CCF39753.1 hypothetical protein CH063_02195 [Colletotrichum higginsianum]